MPNWKAGDTTPLGGRTFRVVAIKDEDADETPTLVVEHMPGATTSAAG